MATGVPFHMLKPAILYYCGFGIGLTVAGSAGRYAGGRLIWVTGDVLISSRNCPNETLIPGYIGRLFQKVRTGDYLPRCNCCDRPHDVVAKILRGEISRSKLF